MNPSFPTFQQTELIDGLARRTLSPDLLPTDFLEIFEELRCNSFVVDILSLGQEEGEERVKKLTYARAVMTAEIYDAVGQEAIAAKGMTLDKICTIGIGDPETARLRDGGLNLKQTEAMTGEWLAHPGMTVDKITLLGFGATAEQIREIGPEHIAQMPQAELDRALFT